MRGVVATLFDNHCASWQKVLLLFHALIPEEKIQLSTFSINSLGI